METYRAVHKSPFHCSHSRQVASSIFSFVDGMLSAILSFKWVSERVNRRKREREDPFVVDPVESLIVSRLTAFFSQNKNCLKPRDKRKVLKTKKKTENECVKGMCHSHPWSTFEQSAHIFTRSKKRAPTHEESNVLESFLAAKARWKNIRQADVWAASWLQCISFRLSLMTIDKEGSDLKKLFSCSNHPIIHARSTRTPVRRRDMYTCIWMERTLRHSSVIICLFPLNRFPACSTTSGVDSNKMPTHHEITGADLFSSAACLSHQSLYDKRLPLSRCEADAKPKMETVYVLNTRHRKSLTMWWVYRT